MCWFESDVVAMACWWKSVVVGKCWSVLKKDGLAMQGGCNVEVLYCSVTVAGGSLVVEEGLQIVCNFDGDV